MSISKSTVLTSLIWKLLERGGTQGIQFVIQIVLARLLCPEDYGVLAILLAFIALANVFVQSGLNTALIQKRDADQTDFSSVFWLSLLIAALLYILLFFTAPLIAAFYGNTVLEPVLRVIALSLFFGALNSVQNAYVSRNMLFRRFFYSSIGSATGSGIIGIVLAYKGFGIWALVIQYLLNSALISLILWFTVKWRPCLTFSLRKALALFNYGWKLLVSALIDTGYRQLYNLVIGKAYSKNQLGFFSRGEQFPQIITSNIDGSIQSVMLPTISAVNDNVEDVKRITRKSISISSFILMPCMFGLAAVSENLVLVLLTEKWLPSVPFIQLSCIAFAFYPIHTANLTAINAMGRSDVFLKLEVVKKIVGISILIISIPFGLLVMAAARILTSLISSGINAFPNRKLLGYSYFEQIKDILPSILLSIVMAIFVYAAQKCSLPNLSELLIQIALGACIYISMAMLFKVPASKALMNTLKGLRK